MKPSIVWCNRCICSHPEGEHKARATAVKPPPAPPAPVKAPPPPPPPPKDPMKKPVKPKPKPKPKAVKKPARKRKARKTVPAVTPPNVDLKALPTAVAAIVKKDVRRRQLQADRARRYRKHQKKLEMEARA